jgi:hypothetical protein
MMALAADPPTTPIRSLMPENRQYCCDRRNGRPPRSRVMPPPAMNQSGCSSPPPGSAIHRATGAAIAASAPSSVMLTRIYSAPG